MKTNTKIYGLVAIAAVLAYVTCGHILQTKPLAANDLKGAPSTMAGSSTPSTPPAAVVAASPGALAATQRTEETLNDHKASLSSPTAAPATEQHLPDQTSSTSLQKPLDISAFAAVLDKELKAAPTEQSRESQTASGESAQPQQMDKAFWIHSLPKSSPKPKPVTQPSISTPGTNG